MAESNQFLAEVANNCNAAAKVANGHDTDGEFEYPPEMLNSGRGPLGLGPKNSGAGAPPPASTSCNANASAPTVAGMLKFDEQNTRMNLNEQSGAAAGAGACTDDKCPSMLVEMAKQGVSYTSHANATTADLLVGATPCDSVHTLTTAVTAPAP